MSPKKLVSMRVSDGVDEKLSALAEEMGETKANLVSMALNKLYEDIEENKRLSEMQSNFSGYLFKKFSSLSKKDYRTTCDFVDSLRGGLDRIMRYPEENDPDFYELHGDDEVADTIVLPVKNTIEEILDILSRELWKRFIELKSSQGN